MLLWNAIKTIPYYYHRYLAQLWNPAIHRNSVNTAWTHKYTHRHAYTQFLLMRITQMPKESYFHRILKLLCMRVLPHLTGLINSGPELLHKALQHRQDYSWYRNDRVVILGDKYYFDTFLVQFAIYANIFATFFFRYFCFWLGKLLTYNKIYWCLYQINQCQFLYQLLFFRWWHVNNSHIVLRCGNGILVCHVSDYMKSLHIPAMQMLNELIK